jgi:type III secretion protein C
MRHYSANTGLTSAYPRAGRRGYVPLLLILAGSLSLFLAPVVQAARIPFPNRKANYELERESLKSFLQRFFDDLSIPVIISHAVQQEPGTLNGPRQGSTAEVFESIAASNGLVGYFDGSVAYIYASGETSKRHFQIDPDRVNAFKEATIGFGLTDSHDSLQINEDTGSVTASGTPRFLAQLRQLESAFAPRASLATTAEQPAAVRMALRFFPLKYAWAADTTFSVGEQRTVVPGVATILRQLVNPTDAATLGPVSSGNSPAVSGLRGKGLAALGDRLTQAAGSPSGSAPMSQYPAGATTSGPGSEPPPRTNAAPEGGTPYAATGVQPENSSSFVTALSGGQAPRIVADPHRNAVIIRDLPERMPLYEELVQQLDVESEIIQLDATVIDIDTTKARQLGINWSYQHGNTNVSFAGGIQPLDAAGNIAGLQVNSIISNTATFVANVNALEQEGVTNIVQKPQVVTLNDVEAVIESTQSVYVPVSGAFDEDLYGVVAGTVLRVTPHLIEDNGRKRIRLLVSVEDGSLQMNTQTTATTTGQTTTPQQAVPLVTRNAVNTQAIIDAGQGLLLGGLVRHETTRTTNKIPLLGSIPLLGHLFRSDSVSRENTERLFLISPTVIMATAATMPAP